MQPNRTFQTFAAALLVLGMTQTQAAVINFDNTAPVDIPGVADFQTLGDMMDGMLVTASFMDGASETLAWGTTGAGTGGVFGTGWSLVASGDTFNAFAWSFTNDGAGVLTGLTLDGVPGLTLFDTSFGGAFGTDDSFFGRDFATNLNEDALIVATYRQPVGVNGAPPVGDLYHVLDVDFSGMSNGGTRESFLFSQDTDNDARITQVPEPGTMALLGLGLLGAAAVRRRRA